MLKFRRCFRRKNLHVKETVRLLTPRALKAEFPMSELETGRWVESRPECVQIFGTEGFSIARCRRACLGFMMWTLHSNMERGSMGFGQNWGPNGDCHARLFPKKPRTTIGGGCDQ